MPELNDFFNRGFGWICRRCDVDITPEYEDPSRSSRMYREGEAEKGAALANAALAKWKDSSRTALYCPRCGAAESVDEG